MNVYAADVITQNNWLFDIQGAYGILGYGQDSPFWNQYIGLDGSTKFSMRLEPITDEVNSG